MANPERLRSLLLNYLARLKKQEFSILELESTIINAHESLEAYDENGGYELFYSLIRELETSSQIIYISSAANITNGRNQSLPIRWKKVKTKHQPKWDKQQLFQVADRLDISFYLKNPEMQDDKTWEDILSIDRFLKEPEKWQWESKASRSYQLFQDEKYLSAEGKNLLRRLKLTIIDLKIRNYGEPFSYIVHPQISRFSKVSSILIIENLSFFHACRRVFKRNDKVMGMKIDMIVYAEGTHIESSIKYMRDIMEHSDYKIYYVGDMDPSGYSIYYRLKTRNPEYNISLAKFIYYRMVEECTVPTPIQKAQMKVSEHFSFFINEMGEDSLDFKKIAFDIWERNLRIPQEVLPIDILLKGEGSYAQPKHLDRS